MENLTRLVFAEMHPNPSAMNPHTCIPCLSLSLSDDGALDMLSLSSRDISVSSRGAAPPRPARCAAAPALSSISDGGRSRGGGFAQSAWTPLALSVVSSQPNQNPPGPPGRAPVPALSIALSSAGARAPALSEPSASDSIGRLTEGSLLAHMQRMHPMHPMQPMHPQLQPQAPQQPIRPAAAAPSLSLSASSGASLALSVVPSSAGDPGRARGEQPVPQRVPPSTDAGAPTTYAALALAQAVGSADNRLVSGGMRLPYTLNPENVSTSDTRFGVYPLGSVDDETALIRERGIDHVVARLAAALEGGADADANPLRGCTSLCALRAHLVCRGDSSVLRIPSDQRGRLPAPEYVLVPRGSPGGRVVPALALMVARACEAAGALRPATPDRLRGHAVLSARHGDDTSARARVCVWVSFPKDTQLRPFVVAIR